MASRRKHKRQLAVQTSPEPVEPQARPPATAARLDRGVGGWLVLPILLAAAAYARVLRGEFVWDDYPTIVDNVAIKSLAGWSSRFWTSLVHSGRPVTELSFSLNYAMGRLDPWTFHLSNLAIHLATTLLVFYFTRFVVRLAGSPGASGIALGVAGIFAVHPIQTQAVSYVAQRAESLASACYLGVLLLLFTAERRGRTAAGLAAYVAATLLFVVGLGAKVILVTAPVAYLLLAWMIPDAAGRRTIATWRGRLGMLVPWALFAAYFAVTTLRSAMGSIHAGFSVQGLTGWTYFLTQLRVFVTYLRLLFWPGGQNIDWVYPASEGLDTLVLGALAILVPLVAAAGYLFWRCRHRTGEAAATGRLAAFGLAWFFLLLAPTSSFVPLADVIEEHRIYLACWGILLAVVSAGHLLLARRPKATARAAVVAAVAMGAVWSVLAFATYQRNAAWESKLALWGASAATQPYNWRAHLNLGFAHSERREWEDAIREYRRAYELGARSTPTNESFTLNNLAAALANAGRPAEALEPLQRAIEVNPNDVNALVNYANLLFLLKHDLQGAEVQAKRVLALDGANARALNLMGAIRYAANDAPGAAAYFRRSYEVNPFDSQVVLNAGRMEALMGNREKACQILGRIGETRPSPQAVRDASAAAAQFGCVPR